MLSPIKPVKTKIVNLRFESMVGGLADILEAYYLFYLMLYALAISA